MGFNPFRIFSRKNSWSQPDEYSQWDKPPTKRRRVALIAVGSAIGLFALALLLLSGPSPKSDENRVADQSLVASDSQTNNSAPFPSVLPGTKMSAAQCSQRRLQLTSDSQTVDRFDLTALDALNKRIGLYNQDCADTNTTAAQQTEPDAQAKAARAANEAKGDLVKSGGKPQGGKSQKAADPVTTAAVAGTVLAGSKSGAATKTNATPADTKKDSQKELIGSDGQSGEKERPKWNPTVLSIQSLLKKQGFDPGPTDGLMGRKTRNAVKAFQTKHGITPDGLVTLELLEQVLEAHPGGAQKSTFSSDTNPVVKKQPAKSPVATKTALSSSANKPKTVTSKAPVPVERANQSIVKKPAQDEATNNGNNASRSGKQVTLESLNDFERQTIQWVCAGQSASSNGPTYDSCLQDQVARGRRVGKPDLSKLNSFERQAITRLCATARYEQGLAAYYECAGRQRDSVTSIARRPNVSNLGIDVRGAVRRNCDGLQFTESLPVYYRCVDTQIARAKR